MSYELDTHFTMNEQYSSSIYPNGYNPPHRSPSSNRGYNGAATINRQPSRQFDFEDYASSQPHRFADDQYGSRVYLPDPQYESRMPPPMTSNSPRYGYENQTWSGFGGPNSSMPAMSSNTSRPRPRITNDLFAPPLHSTSHIQIQPSLESGFDAVHQQYGLHNNPLPTLGRGRSQNGRPSDEPQYSIDEALIPTAIVIKNIPFAVKKEQLMDIMSNMNLPLPYAFNYHFDTGVFRGLAFANFTTAEETSQVINQMNHMELAGRKLRVEYKKMLPAEQRERIERDKRERRGQLQEQHQPMTASQLHTQSSMNSLNSSMAVATSPSPLSQRNNGINGIKAPDFDLNDPTTQAFYEKLIVFKNDQSSDTYTFPHTTDPEHRRIIHTLAHHMNLEHRSEGAGEHRQLHLTKKPMPPPVPVHPQYSQYDSRRALTRAATIDLSEARDTFGSHGLGRQQSGLLNIPASPGDGASNNSHTTVRGAKSFADLRSWSPSPALSANASFPNVERHVSRYADTHYSNRNAGQSNTTPNLTPTSDDRDAVSGLTSGFDALGFAGSHNRPSIGRANGSATTIRPTQQAHNAGPIGSQRPVNGNYDDNATNGSSALPQRQPTGPGNEWGRGGGGFARTRQNGHANRGSDSSDESNGASRVLKNRY